MATTTTTTTTTPKPTNEELITQMYDKALASQTAQLEQNYNQGVADLQAEQERLQQQTDANLNRTYVEAARDQRNYAEVQNAYGLSSGAMAQARLAQDNQLEADLTALRNAQTTIDANIERERTTLSQQYAAAIAQAQADNDLQKAQALYQDAKEQDALLRQNQMEAGKLMASAGDYSILANIYGLTPEQVALLKGESTGTGTGGTGGTGGGGWLNADGTVNTNMIDTTSQWWKDYAAANGLDPVTGQHIAEDGVVDIYPNGYTGPLLGEVTEVALQAWESGNGIAGVQEVLDAAVADGFPKTEADNIMYLISAGVIGGNG